MGYTNYWTQNYVESIPDELIEKIKQLLSYYKEKHNISEYRKLFCELTCSNISINPYFDIINFVINKPFNENISSILEKYKDDIQTILICFVEYYLKTDPKILQNVNNKDLFLKDLMSIPKLKVNLSKQEILINSFNDIETFKFVIKNEFSKNKKELSDEELNKIYEDYLISDYNLNDYITKVLNIDIKNIYDIEYFLYDIKNNFIDIVDHNYTLNDIDYNIIIYIFFNHSRITIEYIENLIKYNLFDLYKLLSFTCNLLKDEFLTFHQDKEYYIRVLNLDNNCINIYTCYEPFVITSKYDGFNFCKTARYKFDSLVKTLIILCGYYGVFDIEWNCDGFEEFIDNLDIIKDYLNSINFKLIEYNEVNSNDDNTDNYVYAKIDKC